MDYDWKKYFSPSLAFLLFLEKYFSSVEASLLRFDMSALTHCNVKDSEINVKIRLIT